MSHLCTNNNSCTTNILCNQCNYNMHGILYNLYRVQTSHSFHSDQILYTQMMIASNNTLYNHVYHYNFYNLSYYCNHHMQNIYNNANYLCINHFLCSTYTFYTHCNHRNNHSQQTFTYSCTYINMQSLCSQYTCVQLYNFSTQQHHCSVSNPNHCFA